MELRYPLILIGGSESSKKWESPRLDDAMPPKSTPSLKKDSMSIRSSGNDGDCDYDDGYSVCCHQGECGYYDCCMIVDRKEQKKKGLTGILMESVQRQLRSQQARRCEFGTKN